MTWGTGIVGVRGTASRTHTAAPAYNHRLCDAEQVSEFHAPRVLEVVDSLWKNGWKPLVDFAIWMEDYSLVS